MKKWLWMNTERNVFRLSNLGFGFLGSAFRACDAPDCMCPFSCYDSTFDTLVLGFVDPTELDPVAGRTERSMAFLWSVFYCVLRCGAFWFLRDRIPGAESCQVCLDGMQIVLLVNQGKHTHFNSQKYVAWTLLR